MKKLLIILTFTVFLFTSCNEGSFTADEMSYADTSHVCEPDTVYLPVISPSVLEYDIANENRNFGSPDEYAARLSFVDSAGNFKTWHFTDADVIRLDERETKIKNRQ